MFRKSCGGGEECVLSSFVEIILAPPTPTPAPVLFATETADPFPVEMAIPELLLMTMMILRLSVGREFTEVVVPKRVGRVSVVVGHTGDEFTVIWESA